MSGGEYLDARGVAERIGVKRHTIYSYLARGDMPEPDLVWLGHSLWLVSTIDEWRRYRHRKGAARAPIARRRGPRRRQARPVEPEQLWERPPRIARPRRSSTSDGASAGAPGSRIDAQVSEREAQEIAAAVREAGFYCTTEDVLELLTRRPQGSPPLEHARELLRQRVVAKLRERRAGGGTH